MKFAQILGNKVHYIFERQTKPNYAPDIFLVDITDTTLDIQVGWNYNPATEEFTEPTHGEIETIIEPTIQEQILAESQYQTALLEIQSLGGV